MAGSPGAPAWGVDGFTRVFGPAAAAGRLSVLAGALGDEVGENPVVVEHVLRFLAVTTGGVPGYVCTVPDIASATTLSRVDYHAFLQRFGGGGDSSAVLQAKALFVVNPMDGSLVLPPWYHGLNVASAEAGRAALVGRPPGSFLVRLSASQPNALAVSYVVGAGDVRHTRLQHVREGYVVEGAGAAPFPNLPSLILAYGRTWTTPVPSALSAASLLPASRIVTLRVDGAGDGADVMPAHTTPTAGVSASAPPAAVGCNEEFDIMVSYKWDNQALVRRIRDGLVSSGFRVWMDESNMSAAYVKSMVKAVKNAKCVVLCTSNAYCASRNCTTEASLVYEHNKPLVVANMEKGFYPGRAEGVVGALAAARLYVDFTSDDMYDTGMAGLLKQLQDQGITPSRLTAGPGPERLVGGSGASTVPTPTGGLATLAADLAAVVPATGPPAMPAASTVHSGGGISVDDAYAAVSP